MLSHCESMEWGFVGIYHVALTHFPDKYIRGLTQTRSRQDSFESCNKLFKRDRKIRVLLLLEGLPGGASGNAPACRCRRHKRHTGLIPGSGRSPGGGNGNPLHSCLENPVDKRVWRTTIHRVAKNWTQLK